MTPPLAYDTDGALDLSSVPWALHEGHPSKVAHSLRRKRQAFSPHEGHPGKLRRSEAKRGFRAARGTPRRRNHLAAVQAGPRQLAFVFAGRRRLAYALPASGPAFGRGRRACSGSPPAQLTREAEACGCPPPLSFPGHLVVGVRLPPAPALCSASVRAPYTTAAWRASCTDGGAARVHRMEWLPFSSESWPSGFDSGDSPRSIPPPPAPLSAPPPQLASVPRQPAASTRSMASSSCSSAAGRRVSQIRMVCVDRARAPLPPPPPYTSARECAEPAKSRKSVNARRRVSQTPSPPLPLHVSVAPASQLASPSASCGEPCTHASPACRAGLHPPPSGRATYTASTPRRRHRPGPSAPSAAQAAACPGPRQAEPLWRRRGPAAVS